MSNDFIYSWIRTAEESDSFNQDVVALIKSNLENSQLNEEEIIKSLLELAEEKDDDKAD